MFENFSRYELVSDSELDDLLDSRLELDDDPVFVELADDAARASRFSRRIAVASFIVALLSLAVAFVSFAASYNLW